MWPRLKEFWLKYETKVVLFLGFILVAGIAFEAGILKGEKIPQIPIVVEKPAVTQNIENSISTSSPEAQNLALDVKKSLSDMSAPDQKCAFVGSKNSNKYHLPTCRFSKSIKAENRVCFPSQEEAKNKGYLPDTNCIK